MDKRAVFVVAMFVAFFAIRYFYVASIDPEFERTSDGWTIQQQLDDLSESAERLRTKIPQQQVPAPVAPQVHVEQPTNDQVLEQMQRDQMATDMLKRQLAAEQKRRQAEIEAMHMRNQARRAEIETMHMRNQARRAEIDAAAARSRQRSQEIRERY